MELVLTDCRSDVGQVWAGGELCSALAPTGFSQSPFWRQTCHPDMPTVGALPFPANQVLFLYRRTMQTFVENWSNMPVFLKFMSSGLHIGTLHCYWSTLRAWVEKSLHQVFSPQSIWRESCSAPSFFARFWVVSGPESSRPASLTCACWGGSRIWPISCVIRCWLHK